MRKEKGPSVARALPYSTDLLFHAPILGRAPLSCGGEAPASSGALAPVAVPLAAAATVVAVAGAVGAVADITVVIPPENRPLSGGVRVPQDAALASALLVPLRAARQARLDRRHGLPVGLVHLLGPIRPENELAPTVALGVFCQLAHRLDAVRVEDEHAELTVRELGADRLAFQVGVTFLVGLDDAVLVHLLHLDQALHGLAAAAVAGPADLLLGEELLQVGQADLLDSLRVRVGRKVLVAEEDPEPETLVGVVGFRTHQQLRLLLVALAGSLLLAGQGLLGVGVVSLVGRHLIALLFLVLNHSFTFSRLVQKEPVRDMILLLTLDSHISNAPFLHCLAVVCNVGGLSLNFNVLWCHYTPS